MISCLLITSQLQTRVCLSILCQHSYFQSTTTMKPSVSTIGLVFITFPTRDKEVFTRLVVKTCLRSSLRYHWVVCVSGEINDGENSCYVAPWEWKLQMRILESLISQHPPGKGSFVFSIYLLCCNVAVWRLALHVWGLLKSLWGQHGSL